jgi:hypothetical protein
MTNADYYGVHNGQRVELFLGYGDARTGWNVSWYAARGRCPTVALGYDTREAAYHALPALAASLADLPRDGAESAALAALRPAQRHALRAFSDSDEMGDRTARARCGERWRTVFRGLRGLGHLESVPDRAADPRFNVWRLTATGRALRVELRGEALAPEPGTLSDPADDLDF